MVLVIDDDEAVRELMQRFLEKEGFQIRTAANGREGLQLARQLQPDVITLDIRMPDPDGWTVLAQLKHDPETAGIPVIIASMLDDRSHGFALGAEDFITKPFDWPRLARILNKYKIPVGEVLIVDDDAVGRDAMQQLIARQGWKVREAGNGRIALERIAERRPDLILLDLLMPDMNGFELVEALRKEPQLASIPIVVVTAKEITPDDCRRLSGFVDHCLHKGAFQQEELLAEIRRRVGHHVASDVQANSERRHG
jgi:CheY-like chemotaxis protein